MPFHPSQHPPVEVSLNQVTTTKSEREDGTLESLMARASLSNAAEEEVVLDQTVHARQAITPGLKFRDIRLESHYQVDYFAKYITAIRRSIVIGTCLWALFVINDIMKNSIGKRRNFAATVSLRFGVIGLALIALMLTYTQKVGRRGLIWLISTVIVVFGAAQVVSGVIELDTTDPTYSVAIVVISGTSSAFFRLPCWESILCNIAMYAIYTIVTAATGAYDTSTHFGTTCLWLAIGVIIFSLHAYDREWYIRSSYLAQRRLEFEEHKSQKVLLKMLPLSVIEQLRSGAEFMHERHSNISVLFSHLSHFDVLTSAMSPNEVVGLLNQIFSKFDQVTDEFGVYKVETIGDVYLVSAGVPEPRADHANVLTHVAVSMMECIEDFQNVDRMPIQLKIGINSGPVIAGVVGMKYPRFRLMGDVMNTSSRMSSTCDPGDIQLTPSCFQQLHPNEFIIHYRGEIAVKGKGMMRTYLVKGRAKKGIEALEGMIRPRFTHGHHHMSKQDLTGTPQNLARNFGTPRSTPVAHSKHNLRIHSRNQSSSLVLANATPKEYANTPVLAPVMEDTISGHSLSPNGAATTFPSTIQEHSPINVGQGISADAASQSIAPIQVGPGITSSPSPSASPVAVVVDEMKPSTAAAAALAAADSRKVGIKIHLPGHKLRIPTGHSNSGTPVSKSPMSPNNAGNQVSDVSASPMAPQFEIQSVVPAFSNPADVVSASPNPLLANASSQNAPSTPNATPAVAAPSTVVAHGMNNFDYAQVPGNNCVIVPSNDPNFQMTPGTEVQPAGNRVGNEITRLSSVGERKNHSDKFFSDSTSNGVGDNASTSNSNGNHAPLSHAPTQKDIMRISAKDVHVEGLFDGLEWDQLTDPKNPFSLAFVNHPDLERQFQAEFFRRYLNPNRRGILSFLVAQLLLGIYETLFNLPETQSESRRMGLTWIFRLVGLVVGLACFIFTYTHRAIYEKYQQPILSVAWYIMGITLISVFFALNTYLDVYAVTCLLLLLTMTSTFVGLQFVWVTGVSVLFLVWYLGAALIFQSFPLVIFFLLASNVLAITASRSSEYYLRWDFIRHLKLQNEERRTRHFLDNMLPKSVVQEIKLDNSFIAHEFPKASVLFSDIVGFTRIASGLQPEDVVAILNIMFCTFDALSDKHNVYKVETIGDAYLACTNVVNRTPTATEDLVKFALDVQTSARYMHTPDGQPLVIRVGIHTGSVVAGVVGRKMPRYHLFGETVSIAEEMEQNGIPASVVISAATYKECEGFFEVEPLEPVVLHAMPAKNILPNGPPTTDHPAQTEEEPEKTFVHRYRVVAHLGGLAPKRQSAEIQPAVSICAINHEHDASCYVSESPVSPVGAMVSLNSSGDLFGPSRPANGNAPKRPTSAKLNERPPPPFVMNILGKIQAKNFQDQQARMAKREQAMLANSPNLVRSSS